jgi:predicted TPR repeat methyltransferase
VARASASPAALKGLMLRAVAIDSKWGTRINAINADIVAQTLDPGEGSGFDLVVATNVLVYCGRFEQALAMTSIAHMMNAGGIFLANSVLPAQRPPDLEYLGRRSVSYSIAGAFGDDVVAYRKKAR